jgi:dTDP-4-amino-4,6-dideoxygalactose transaminase
VPRWPCIPADGRDAVARALDTGAINYWTGQECRAFEQEFAEYVQTPYALAVANGTLALELALRAFGIGEGGRADEVIVPSRTFIATAGAVAAVGATPVIADIDPDTNCLTALSVAKVTTPRTRAVIVVHPGGYPADMDALTSLTKQLGIRVIEDCAQAHGALYRGRPVGGIGDAGCYSFCQEKILPLGEGGMIVFREGEDARAAYERAWAYRDHGRSFERAHGADVAAASPQFRYLNDSFGTNARLGEMEGALGRVLLRYLPAWHETRVRNARVLCEELADCAGVLQLLDVPAEEAARGTEHGCYRLYGLLNVTVLREGWTRERVIDAINAAAEAAGIDGGVAQYGSCACIGREAAFAATGFEVPDEAALPGAVAADTGSIAFYVDPARDETCMRTTAACVRDVLKEAAGV